MDNENAILNQLIAILRKRKLMIATAESCTGGLIAYRLTDLSGSSTWFERGFVTYSNLAKQQMLGVPEVLLDRYGAVSEQAAQAMAVGALQHSAAEVAIAVTGIAGPTGGSKAKPVGTVWFGFAGQGHQPKTNHVLFPQASRQQIRELACVEALQGMLNYLSSYRQN